MANEGRIRLLSEKLANKIAAGEVVERPASVVKELMENSIDAGAKSIRVEVEGGGRNSISVIDDGFGMSPDDALLSLERHATSKISTDDDLFAINTLGFRGEALPSIASVSRFEIITRERSRDEGSRIRVDGGSLSAVEPAGCAPGTAIHVRNLFYNMPARKKFLRSTDTEFGHVADVVSRIALAAPTIRFELIHDGRTIIDAAPTSNRADRLADTLGSTNAANMKPFSMSVGSDHLIDGFASMPELSRANGNYLFVYVNGRFVRDRLVNHAIIEAYRGFLPRGRYPVVVMFVNVPPSEVDVNVHPAKAEVRFRDSNAVHDLIVRAVVSAFEKPKPVEPASPSFAATPVAISDVAEIGGASQALLRSVENSERPESETHAPRIEHHAPVEIFSREPVVVDTRARLAVGATTTPIESGYFQSLKVLGQLREMYIVCQSHDGLALIDQHAAHERTVFERLKREYVRKNIQRQTLLFPETIELGHREARDMNRVLDEIVSLGFDIEVFGQRSFLVRSLPAILGSADPKALVMDIVDALARTHRPGPLTDWLDDVFARMSCHSVVRAGKTMSLDETKALLKALDEADFPLTCPHGRPICVRISYDELEKMFGRK